MSIQAQIEAALAAAMALDHLELENESHQHNVPPGSESHFKAVLVSAAFEGKRKVARHQAVYTAMGELMQQIHALALHTYTPDEWRERHGEAPLSPPCLGGSKGELS
jgi:BolA protein